MVRTRLLLSITDLLISLSNAQAMRRDALLLIRRLYARRLNFLLSTPEYVSMKGKISTKKILKKTLRTAVVRMLLNFRAWDL